MRIFPSGDIVDCQIKLPSSKSYIARKLVMDYLGGYAIEIDPDSCNDIKVVAGALSTASDSANAQAAAVDLGGSATALRLLTAVFASRPGCEVTLDGDESLRRRPLTTIVEALRQLGASIEYLNDEGYAPVRIKGRKLSGGNVAIDATVSSQNVSALMLIAPYLDGGLTVRPEGEAVSLPYINMTARMMQRRGIEVDVDRDSITIQPGSYAADTRQAELDWSAASYWYELAAITAGWVTLPGLHADDLQGDRILAEIYPRLGVLSDFESTDEDDRPIDGVQLSATPDLWGRIELDLSDNPDLTPALAVTAAALQIPFKLSGLGNLRIKECDRLAALQSELLKLGIVTEIEGNSVLQWEGRRVPIIDMPRIDPHGDHRIAMAFAPLAVFIPGLIIEHPEVVDKSYPGYWKALESAGFNFTAEDEIEEIDQ